MGKNKMKLILLNLKNKNILGLKNNNCFIRMDDCKWERFGHNSIDVEEGDDLNILIKEKILKLKSKFILLNRVIEGKFNY